MARAGRINRWGIPKGVAGWLQCAAMIDRYRDMVVMGFPPLPPPAIQRLLIPPLARLAARRGYGAGQPG